jgi:hypothetical protein
LTVRDEIPLMLVEAREEEAIGDADAELIAAFSARL